MVLNLWTFISTNAITTLAMHRYSRRHMLELACPFATMLYCIAQQRVGFLHRKFLQKLQHTIPLKVHTNL